jgi:hypothetical protein
MHFSNELTVGIAGLVVVLVILTIVTWWFTRRRRTSALRERFGPEYDRVVQAYGEPEPAEAALEERRERVEQLDIRPLNHAEQERFSTQWRRLQTLFVADPEDAVRQADHLVAEVMRARRYPMTDFEQRAADVSVDHPQVVEQFRLARATALRNEQGEATTEQMRQAMIGYRALLDDLLEAKPAGSSLRQSSSAI